MAKVRSGPLAAWTRAWIAGRVSLDEVLDAVRGRDAPHLASSPAPGTGSGLARGAASGRGEHDSAAPLRELLVAWRQAGARPELRLPVAGDVRGLPGPAPFRAAALEAGEAVVGGGLGAVPLAIEYGPSSAPTEVTWRVHEIDTPPPDPLDLREAQYNLTIAIRESATALAQAQVAGASAAVTELLGDARRAGDRLNLPPQHPGPAVALLSQAERLQAVLDLVATDPHGGAVDRAGIAARHDALRPLATAVRRARVAAYNS